MIYCTKDRIPASDGKRQNLGKRRLGKTTRTKFTKVIKLLAEPEVLSTVEPDEGAAELIKEIWVQFLKYVL